MTLLETLDRLEKLAGIATPGPWEALQDVHAYGSYVYITSHKSEAGPTKFPGKVIAAPVNRDLAEYVAASNPDTILKLCKALRLALGNLEYLSTTANLGKGESGDGLVAIEILRQIDALFEEGK